MPSWSEYRSSLDCSTELVDLPFAQGQMEPSIMDPQRRVEVFVGRLSNSMFLSECSITALIMGYLRGETESVFFWPSRDLIH